MFVEEINMLKGIPKILSPELLKVLCEMGHSDRIVIADGNFPSESMGKDAIVIRCDGHGVPEILDAILQVFPLDTYVENPVNLMQLMPDEKITAMIPIREYEDGQYLLMATEKGLVKKTPIKDYANVRKTGLAAIVLREDDKLIEVKITDDEQDVILVTKYGMCIRFSEKDVRPTGRVSMGVRGMNLGDHDEVIGMQISNQGKYLLIASEKGMGKLTDMDEFTRQNRGGKGVKCYKITEKTGDVVGMKAVDEDSEIMMINTEGIVIRMKCSDISVYGRITSGVKLINLPENEKVASIAKVRKASAEIDGEEIEISEDEEETETPIEE